MLNHCKKTFIVAEISANHNNCLNTAIKTIEAIAASGADAVKVQTYKPQSLSLNINNEYFGPKQSGPWKGIKPWDLYQQACMPYAWQAQLKAKSEELGLLFFSSPFDFEAVDFLESLDIPMYKIASFEITDIPLIEKVAKTGKPIIISTGVATDLDIQLAIDTCIGVQNHNITLLKCTSQYPATLELANLRTIPDMQSRFNVNIGLSDHTMGFLVPIVAVSLGATMVEKHFILDRKMGGPDSTFSMEPQEFKVMVKHIRDTEITLGVVSYEKTTEDLARRRSLFAVKDIEAGDRIESTSVRSLRPGAGIHPKYIDSVIGKTAKTRIEKGTPLSFNLFED